MATLGVVSRCDLFSCDSHPRGCQNHLRLENLLQSHVSLEGSLHMRLDAARSKQAKPLRATRVS